VGSSLAPRTFRQGQSLSGRVLLQVSPSGGEFDLLASSQEDQGLFQPGYPFEPPVAEEFRIISGDDDAELRGIAVVFAEFLDY